MRRKEEEEKCWNGRIEIAGHDHGSRGAMVLCAKRNNGYGDEVEIDGETWCFLGSLISL